MLEVVRMKNRVEAFLVGEASMVALDITLPINEDALPITLNKEKNMNSFPRGVTSDT